VQAGGLDAILMSLFGPRIVKSLLAEELANLERHARAHGPDLEALHPA
jgi:hypothetical protein